MAQTQVTTGQMGNVADQLDALIQQFRNAFTDIGTKAVELDSMWSGDAHDKFKNIITADAPKFTQFEQLLKDYSNGIKANAITYATAEQNALDTIQAKH